MAGTKKGLGRLFKPYWLRIAGLSALMILHALLQVAMALLLRGVIDAALSNPGRLGFWSGAFVADLILQIAVSALCRWSTGSTMDRLSADLRLRFLRSAVYSADSRLQEFHSGELLSRGMEDVYTVCDGMVNALPLLIGQVTRLAAAFCAVLMIYPGVAVVLLAAVLLVCAGVACIRPVLKKHHRLVREAEEQVMATMQEDLQQLELIQSLNVRQQILKRFHRRLKNSLNKKRTRRVWSVSSNGLLNVASAVGTGTVLLWGVGKVAAGVLSYGSLTSMLQLMNQFRAPALGLSGVWTRLTAVEVAAERLIALLLVEEAKPAQIPDIKPKAVVFDRVTFRYPGDETPVIEDFSVRFPLEGWSCLTGISGKGKSTLFKLMLGLYTPQSGRVYLETDRGEVECTEQTRLLFAYVPQDYALFSGTVLENLLLVAPEVQQQQRRDALAIAQADFVWELTQGEQTHVGENNTGLSKGQLQRLAIARAVLMERPVFLLDECTSALDAQTEKAVLQGLRALGKDAILVTHRPEALEDLEGITTISMETD